MRCLKRYVAREVYHELTNPTPTPRHDDLRPAQLSRLERGLTNNPDLEHRYRQWLTNTTT
jgi:transposase